MQTEIERPSAITFRGKPMTLVGAPLAVGETAPDFALAAAGFETVTRDDATANGTRPVLLIVFPSLDTPTCSLETLTFQKRFGELPETLATYVVSADLPFAQARWADEHEADAFTYLSVYRDRAFGPAYGVSIKEIGLLARSIFVIDRRGTLTYAHVVPEVSQEPDYDAAIAAARAVA